jgi:histidine ammonia-lyase
MAAHGARRLIAMADNTAAVIAIELLAAAQGCDFHRGLASSRSLENVRQAVRARIPGLVEDRHLHPDLKQSLELVQSGALMRALDGIVLPGLDRS